MSSQFSTFLDSFGIPRTRRNRLSVFSARGRRAGKRSEIPGLSIEPLTTLAGGESLEQRKVMDVAAALVGTALTLVYDDTSPDSVVLTLNGSGYTLAGATITGTASSATSPTSVTAVRAGGTKVLGLTVTGPAAGTQSLTGGLTVGNTGVATSFNTASLNTSLTLGGGSLVIDAAAITLNAASVTAGGGSLTLNGTTTLVASANLVTQGGAVNLNGAVNAKADGVQALNISTAGGAVQSNLVVNAIGGTTNLASLTVSTGSGNVTLGHVNTTGPQTFTSTSGLVKLNGDYGTVNGAFTSSAANLAGNVTVTTGTGAVTFARVDGAFGLNISAANVTTFTGAVGGLTPLGGLNISSGSGSAVLLNVTTNGTANQNYAGNVTLNGIYTTNNRLFTVSGANVTLTGATTVNVGTNVATLSNVSGAFALSLNGSAAANNTIGSLNVESVNAAVTPGAKVNLLGSAVTTGTQTYGVLALGGNITTTNSNVTVLGTTSLNSTANAATISIGSGTLNLAGAVNANAANLQPLTITAGNTSFGGNVGNATPLASLSITGPVTTAGNITTSLAQSYGGAATLAAGNYTSTTATSRSRARRP